MHRSSRVLWLSFRRRARKGQHIEPICEGAACRTLYLLFPAGEENPAAIISMVRAFPDRVVATVGREKAAVRSEDERYPRSRRRLALTWPLIGLNSPEPAPPVEVRSTSVIRPFAERR
jgi:hypothetical protein